MWKWLIILVVLILAIAPASPTIAGTSDDITITATGIVVGAPFGFTVYYISDYEIGIMWTNPPGAVNTMIRAKYGSYPSLPAPGTEPTDGYMVYYGIAESCSDTAVNLDETASLIYYRAWCQTAGGAWSPLYGEGNIEGVGMTLIAFVILAIGLTIGGFWLKKTVIVVGAAFGWLLLALFGYFRSTATWDIYYITFWLGIAMVLGIFIESMFVLASDRGQRTEDDIATEKQRERREVEEQPMNAIDKIRVKEGLGVSEARQRNIERRRFS